MEWEELRAACARPVCALENLRACPCVGDKATERRENELQLAAANKPWSKSNLSDFLQQRPRPASASPLTSMWGREGGRGAQSGDV